MSQHKHTTTKTCWQCRNDFETKDSVTRVLTVVLCSPECTATYRATRCRLCYVPAIPNGYGYCRHHFGDLQNFVAEVKA